MSTPEDTDSQYPRQLRQRRAPTCSRRCRQPRHGSRNYLVGCPRRALRGKLALWDFCAAPDGPIDTSAAAIFLAGLVRLVHLEGTSAAGRRYAEEADQLEQALLAQVTPTHRGDFRPAGMLLNGCYHRPAGRAVASELVWGDYYLLESLAVLSGQLDPALA